VHLVARLAHLRGAGSRGGRASRAGRCGSASIGERGTHRMQRAKACALAAAQQLLPRPSRQLPSARAPPRAPRRGRACAPPPPGRTCLGGSFSNSSLTPGRFLAAPKYL
jgi:hypothetical protein